MLEFELIAESLVDSFLLLSLKPLEPILGGTPFKEHLVECNGVYQSPIDWENGTLDEEDDNHQNKPKRFVTRLLSGRLLFVAKTSLWNYERRPMTGVTITWTQTRSAP